MSTIRGIDEAEVGTQQGNTDDVDNGVMVFLSKEFLLKINKPEKNDGNGELNNETSGAD